MVSPDGKGWEPPGEPAPVGVAQAVGERGLGDLGRERGYPGGV